MAPPILPDVATPPPEGGFVFEGPEKKLEVFFSTGAHSDGFRRYGQSTWSDILVAASCSILHCEANQHFDAYLLSESSLFVYPNRVILKTCGTTGLLLVLPKLLTLAKSLGVVIEHVHYGHYRYKFPEQQFFPHGSFEQEEEYLTQIFGSVESRVLGPSDGRCWYALCTRQQLPEPRPPPSTRDGDDLFEVAMEGLSSSVCKQFVEASHPGLSGAPLAQHMTAISGIGALLPGVTIDDWAFEPCGYSMNGLRGAFYYTIHITPEEGFSYASFETNDPQYRDPKWVEAITSVFQPSVLTVTLTTREESKCELPSYSLSDFERSSCETASFGAGVTMCCTNFHAEVRSVRKRKGSPAPSSSTELTVSDSEGVNSELGSEHGSDGSSVNGEVDVREDVREDAVAVRAC
ncbi:hypothetical protein AB1Y20_005072 [Prymnesium parvum]|uniref:adenosylmethionine decarboxylase n=1 Tax=Prymnesium parvum TaxID=97485 RepID=A0AB34J494_PRYPA|mmetsp:Transcript_27205/g.67475  ORF Transcript_27205/g.67475 Transcript_27205/m.67475 type:complete len:405 (+) Transcript_27205:119-1333(+)